MTWIGGTAAIDKRVKNVGVRKTIESSADFSAWRSGDLITVPDGSVVEIADHIDLVGARIACAGAAAIFGFGSEVTSLSSTGLTGNPLVYAPDDLTIRDLLIVPPVDVDGIQLDNASGAYDWRNVNFIGAGCGVYLSDAANLILETTLFACGQGGIEIDGAIASLVMSDSVVSALASSFGIKFSSGANFSRRERIVDGVFIVSSGAIGLDTDKTYIAIPEAHILRDMNFSGAGTYVNGIAHTDDEARWYGCRGITNSARVGLAYFATNATVTTISVAGTYYKVQGTTVASSVNQRFSHSSNRLTYTSELVETFEIKATASIQSTNNHVVGIKVYKNGVAIDAIAGRTTISANNRAENIFVRTFVTLGPGDYIELFVTDETGTGDITVTDMTLSAKAGLA